jgi:hypothetical protein
LFSRLGFCRRRLVLNSFSGRCVVIEINWFITKKNRLLPSKELITQFWIEINFPNNKNHEDQTGDFDDTSITQHFRPQ